MTNINNINIKAQTKQGPSFEHEFSTKHAELWNTQNSTSGFSYALTNFFPLCNSSTPQKPSTAATVTGIRLGQYQCTLENILMISRK